jgi:putative transcriptional regulator
MRTALILVLSLLCVPSDSTPAAAQRGPPTPGEERLRRGVLLVAAADLGDPNFTHSVVLITHFDESGSAGLILNRPLPVPAVRALPPLEPMEPDPGNLFLGGPVAVGTLQLLIRTDASLDAESRIVDDVHLVNRPETLNDLVDGRLRATAARLYAGYAGWGAGQLEAELLRGDWILRAADAGAIFAPDPERIWPDFMERAGERWVRVPHDDADADTRGRYNSGLAIRTGPRQKLRARGGMVPPQSPSG